MDAGLLGLGYWEEVATKLEKLSVIRFTFGHIAN